jgi:hypothetical protein
MSVTRDRRRLPKGTAKLFVVVAVSVFNELKVALNTKNQSSSCYTESGHMHERRKQDVIVTT